MPQYLKNIPLSEHTTIGLGGPACLFAVCTDVDHIRDALVYARTNQLPVHILGGGSNTIFPDRGYAGLVIKVALRGVREADEGPTVLVSAAAGESWDALVLHCVMQGFGGIETLSGIPGFVGATPIQNVGAYGQEVAGTVDCVEALDRHTLAPVKFPAEECLFGYRQSRFRAGDAGKYVITRVSFRLRKNAAADIRYAELRSYLDAQPDFRALAPGRPVLERIRVSVLELRRRKSMVIDPADPHSRSVGSFFVNPVLDRQGYERALDLWHRTGGTEPIPVYPSGDRVKIPAAWLIEHAGFSRGFRRGGAGISDHHALALVNYHGTTSELLALADQIRAAVRDRFGIVLEREPVVLD